MKPEPRPTIHMEKRLGWAHRLGGAESLGIFKADRTVLAKFIESQVWHQPDSSMAPWGEGTEKGQWPLLALVPDTSASPSVPLVSLKLPSQCQSPEGVSLSR